MKISEILQAFHRLQACDRMDLICRMLRHCVAFESRFLGIILLDASKEHYKSQVNRIEINANRVNYYKSFQESGMSHQVCEKLCCALSVVHSDNRPVAEVIFNLLNDKKVLTLFEECIEHKVLQDFRLLYVMAVNHPAFSFNQRHLLMYNFLQRMDIMYIEKSKYSFSGSFSGSVEKALSGEVDSSKYPPEIQFSSPAPDAYITRCEVHSVYRRAVDKRYVYMVQVEWSDGATYTVRRTYGDFFSFQTKLLDLFPEEGGQKGKKHPRLIPYLPGKNYQRFLKSRETAEKRLPELHRYSRELISLPEHIPRSHHVLDFFRPRPSDKTEEYPPLHKITTLYDLLESGKIRSRVFSEPLHGSPTHSPITHSRGSPLQRASASLAASADVSPSTPPSRVSQTLPSPAPIESANDPITPVIPRRPTYPLNRNNNKSAFLPVTPLGATSMSEDELLASTATLTMAASDVSIAGGMSSGPHTPTSHLSSSSTSLTAPTHSPQHTASNSDTLKSTERSDTLKNTERSDTLKSTEKSASSQAIAVGMSSSSDQSASQQLTRTLITTQVSETPTSSAQQQCITTESPLPRHPVAVLQHTPHQTGVSLTNSASMITQLVPVQPAPMLVSSSFDSHVMYSQGMALLGTRGEVITSPTSPTSLVSSPHLPSSIRPSINSPSPTLSGTTTPHGGGYIMSTTGYPSSQIINMASPYSPIPTYQYFSGSPLGSPIMSPKTPKMYGSYNAVNRTPSEHDTLFKWMKALRLHKYYGTFDNVTFDEMCSMSVEQLEARGMTQGAAKKLFRKLEELKRSNFPGFRDMPVAPGMTRKPSTCSLPASLLMERGITPSSSFEGFSPTGSTCSLDKFGQNSHLIGRITTPTHHSYRYSGGDHHERQSSRSSCSSAVIEDAAVLKVVPLHPGVPGQGESVPLSSESPISSVTRTSPSAAKRASKSVPVTPPLKPNHLSASNTLESNTVPDSESTHKSWADLSGSHDNMGGRPAWAIMPANGEVKPNGTASHKLIPSGVHGHSKVSGGVSDSHHIIPIKTHPENPFHHYNSQEKVHMPAKPVPHTPSRARHAPVAKRNSSEGYPSAVNSSLAEVSPGRHKPPAPVANRTDTVPNANWVPGRHDLLQQSTLSAVKTFPNPPPPHPQQHVVQRVAPQYPVVNGGLKPAAPQGGHGVLYLGARLVNHRAEPGSVSCFNCGKGGHSGMTCPANTMETNDPGTFHKKLETLVHPPTKPPVL